MAIVGKMARRARMGALFAAVMAAAVSPAHAGTTSYTGGNCTTLSCSGTSFGMLSVPTSITFTDQLGQNTGTTAVTSTDNWTFTLPAVSLGATVTGEQIDLSSFAVSGTVDSFALYSVGAGNVLNLILGGTINTPFSQIILDPLVTGGSYQLSVQSTLNPGSIGSYTGTLVAAAVPEPESWLTLAGGLALLAGAVAVRRRRR